MAAPTFVQAVLERYQQVVDAPAIGVGAWVAAIPEGAANDLPNVCITHLGTRPEYSRGGVAYETARFRIEVYDAGLELSETLASRLVETFGIESLEVTGASVLCFRDNYLVTRLARRGPNGEFVYRVVIDYQAKIGKRIGA